MNTLESYIKPGKFIDPLSDFGFRRYFGSEPNKGILIEFLNDLFEGEKRIETREYGPNEHDGDDKEDRRVVFDLHCRGSNGEYFIIEMQRILQEYFRDRTLYYSSRLIQRQLPKGQAFNSYPKFFLSLFWNFVWKRSSEAVIFMISLFAVRTRAKFFTKSWALNS